MPWCWLREDSGGSAGPSPQPRHWWLQSWRSSRCATALRTWVSIPTACRRTGPGRRPESPEEPGPTALRTPALWLLLLAAVGTFCLWQVIVTQGPLHLQDRGFEPETAAFFYSLAIGLSIAGRFSVAALGDVVEPRFLYAFAMLCLLAGGALFWFVSPDVMWAAYLYPLLAGFGMGAAYICDATMVGNYWGPEVFAKIRAVVGPIAVIFEAGVPPLAGFLYDLHGTYLSIMIITGSAAVLGLFAILLCTPPRPAG
jgi:MFS family permease